MSNLGIGVKLGMLSTSQETSRVALQQVIGKKIVAIDINEDRLLLTFTNGDIVRIRDGGQSCCETRYLTCDDDIQAFIGASLIKVEEREAPDGECEYGVHEVAFLIVTTSRGAFTVETHNEHNGYYGGFLLRAEIFKSILEIISKRS